MNSSTRRSFIKTSCLASAGTASLVNTIAQLKLFSASASASSIINPFGDYKALVCIYLAGGNDALNTIHPTGSPAAGNLREDYEKIRGALRLRNDLSEAGLPLTPVETPTAAFQRFHGGAVSPLGAHYNMPGFQQLFNDGDLAAVFNVGTLLEPLTSVAEYNDVLKKKPLQLFSHSDQTVQWQTSISSDVSISNGGWGGRMAELLNAGNAGSKVSMSISIDGVNTFQLGSTDAVVQYAVNNAGAAFLDGFGTSYADALNTGSTFDNSSYRSTDAARRLRAFQDILRRSEPATNSKPLLSREYDRILRRARRNEAIITDAAGAAADARNLAINNAFTTAVLTDNPLAARLRMVARLIAGRSFLGNQRQVFFVGMGGYDTHSGSLPAHAELMRKLSLAMKAFSDALKTTEVNAWENTVAFTASDFGRSFTANGSDRAELGSDHAWSGSAYVMGGPVRGGRFFGDYPSLKGGNASLDVGRGRLIPTYSVDQYSAVLAKWFGADNNCLETIFPNLGRFNNPFSPSTNLNFLNPA